MAKTKDPTKFMLNLVSEIRKTIREEMDSLDDITKSKWQIVEAAKNVFGANYNFTHFAEGSNEGVIGVSKPTLHQLTTFNHEIRNIGSVTTIESQEKEDIQYIALNIRLVQDPENT